MSDGGRRTAEDELHAGDLLAREDAEDGDELAKLDRVGEELAPRARALGDAGLVIRADVIDVLGRRIARVTLIDPHERCDRLLVPVLGHEPARRLRDEPDAGVDDDWDEDVETHRDLDGE